MKIPTILSDASIHTGSTGPNASPDDFGGQVGESIARTAAVLGHSAIQVEDLAKAQKHLDDLTWAGQSIEQEKNYVNKWMADPNNNTKETFPDDLQRLTDSRINDYAGKAPSTRALAMFKQHMFEFAGTRYEAALQTASRTRLSNAALTLDKQSGDAMDSYRVARDVPWVDAGQDLQDSVDQISKNIDQTFGTISPTLANKLKEKLVVDATYASMRDDPKLAAKILDKSKTLDEHERFIIQDHIENASRSKNAVEIEAFKQRREDQFAAVQFGKSTDKIPLKEYQAYYRDDQAQAMKMRDDAVIDTYNRSNTTYDNIKGFAATYQQQELGKIQADAKTEQDREVLQILGQKIHQNTQLQEKDPIGWMQQNNSFVRDALDRAVKSTDTQRVGAIKELNDVMLKFQGAAPLKDEVLDHGLDFQKDPKTGYFVAKPSTTTIDRRTYLNMPTNARHLMSVDDAEKNADEINRGSPKDALNAITKVLSSYPDEKYQNIAFNDMVTLPRGGRGIKQEYQLAFLNQGAPWVDSYVGAIGNAESIKKVEPDKRADFEKALNADKNWVAFSHSMMGDNFQRGDQVEGFKSGILSYAYARATQTGDGPAASIKIATSQLIANELGFANVNGQTMMIMRNPGTGKPYRSEQDIKTIGRNMELSLQFINPGEVKLEDERGRSIFPGLQNAGITEKAKLQAIRNALTMNGLFQTSADGQSATLYYHDANNHFEVRDKNNNAFRIKFDDITGFTFVPGDRGDFGQKIQHDSETGLPLGEYRAIMNLGPMLGHRSMDYSLPDNYTNWPSVGIIQRVKR